VFDRGVRLPGALSPHLAARRNNQPIEVDAVLNLVTAEPSSDRWIVEGAGGVLVPVNDADLMVDLMVRLRLPVVVVARTTLGTINHALLTIEALRARSLEVAGVLMVGTPNRDNRDAIQSYGRVPMLGEMPMLDPLTPVTLEQWSKAELDRAGLLTAHLRPQGEPFEALDSRTS
jgi:dethiobiotin synthetase